MAHSAVVAYGYEGWINPWGSTRFIVNFFAIVTQWFTGLWSNLLAAIQRRSQILLFVLVLFIGVSTVVLGSVSIKRSIEAPFAQNKTNALATAEQTGAINIKKDTDGDGLLDSDELSAYGTSPYLADSDSDGVSDGEEIAKGTDPNCPAGKTCTTSAIQPPATSGSSIGDILIGGISSPSATPSVAELRDILKQGGLPANQVDALSDEQILQAYNESLAKTQGNNSSPDTAPATDTSSNLTAEQIRSLLISNGVPEENIKNVSDEDLMRIYDETIQELQQKQTKP